VRSFNIAGHGEKLPSAFHSGSHSFFSGIAIPQSSQKIDSIEFEKNLKGERLRGFTRQIIDIV